MDQFGGGGILSNPTPTSAPPPAVPVTQQISAMSQGFQDAMSGGGFPQLSWAPGNAVSPSMMQNFMAQPLGFWQGLFGPNQLGMGRGFFPSNSGGFGL